MTEPLTDDEVRAGFEAWVAIARQNRHDDWGAFLLACDERYTEIVQNEILPCAYHTAAATRPVGSVDRTTAGYYAAFDAAIEFLTAFTRDEIDRLTLPRDWAVGATVIVTPEVSNGSITLRAEIDWGTVIDGLREGDEEGTDPVLIALAEAPTIPIHATILRRSR